jgi:hypothetical protein
MVASCEVALEAAHRLDAGLALGFRVVPPARGRGSRGDPQPVDQLCALVDQRFAVIAQQPDLHGVLVEERGRETLDASQRTARAISAGIDLVGLPWLAFAAA